MLRAGNQRKHQEQGRGMQTSSWKDSQLGCSHSKGTLSDLSDFKFNTYIPIFIFFKKRKKEKRNTVKLS